MKVVKDRIESYAPATAQKNINLNILRNVVIPLAPLLEQRKIIEEIEHKFSVADEIEKVAEQSLRQSERLHQSILKRAFEGKLVPQDSVDEPTDRILERIREERGKHELETKSDKKSGLRQMGLVHFVK
jgi:type I restriction enzyme S subunit